MTHPFLAHIQRSVTLTEDEQKHILSVLQRKVLAKKSYLLEAGTVYHNFTYIEKGCMRIFSTDVNGQERNVFFALEDWWPIDLKSFIEQSPARYSIECLEDCVVWQLSKSQFDKLLADIPVLEKWLRLLLQNALIASENRIDYKATLSTEQRYEKFLEKYQGIENRITQKHVASYIGASPEFLSKLKAQRLRKEKSRKKT